MKRAVCIAAVLTFLGVVCKFCPLFHIVPLKRAESEKDAGVFNAAKFADDFWSQKLQKSFDHAVDAKTLLTAIQANPGDAQKKYARSLSLGGGYFYYLRGEGRVLTTNDSTLSLVINPGATNAEVVLEMGMIFGNAVRDGTGLLNASDYPNLQDFNSISAELNKLVEAKILPPLRAHAQIGSTIDFVGCAEVDDESTDLNPLQVVPVQIQTE
jgi:predicted lipoprotein